ncbi:MAG: type I 3-dehydroquinate dehydratase [Deltaproteobacteria bacterium]|nr:type I 3-dehydroquinate dehydratase [Deltaproteobacteria bacterium]
MICIPIVARENAEALAMMERAMALAGLVELRIDRMRNPDLKRLLGLRRIRAIVTNRRREEGGGFSGTEKERVTLLSEAARLGADYVDVEAETDPALKEELRRVCAGSGTKRIVSWHDFSGTPPAPFLKTRLAACMADRPDIVKTVTLAERAEDSLRVLELIPLARQRGQAITAFCMGEMGKISRVMAPLLGSAIHYAPLEPEGASAPGQLTAGRMREIHRVLRELIPGAEDHSLDAHLPGVAPAEEKRSFTL